MFEQLSPETLARIDGRPLRLILPGGGRGAYFCPLCDCAKSGSVDSPNPHAEWCRQLTCPCHVRDSAPHADPG